MKNWKTTGKLSLKLQSQAFLKTQELSNKQDPMENVLDSFLHFPQFLICFTFFKGKNDISFFHNLQ
jgi:hypothetical protein